MKEIEKLSHAFALTRGHPGKAGETLKDSHGPCVDYIRAKDGFEAGFRKAREMAVQQLYDRAGGCFKVQQDYIVQQAAWLKSLGEGEAER